MGYHKLNKDTNKVICVECGHTIITTEHLKKALISMKQVTRDQPESKSDFSAECTNCNFTGAPTLKRYGKLTAKVVCSKCFEVNEYLTKYFLQYVKGLKDITAVDASDEEMEKLGLLNKNSVNSVKEKLSSKPKDAVLWDPTGESEKETKSLLDAMVNKQLVNADTKVVSKPEPKKVKHYNGQPKVLNSNSLEELNEPIELNASEELAKRKTEIIEKVQNRHKPKKKTVSVPKIDRDSLREQYENLDASITKAIKPNKPKEFSDTEYLNQAGIVDE